MRLKTTFVIATGRAMAWGMVGILALAMGGCQAEPTGKHPAATSPLAQERLKSLVKDLQSQHDDARNAAEKELVAIGEPAIPALGAALLDTEGTYYLGRSAAANILGKIGSKQAVPFLLKALENDWDDLTRWHAAMALGEIGDPSAVAPMAKILDMAESVAATRPARRDYKTESGIVWGLGMIGTPQAVNALQKYLVVKNPASLPGVIENSIDDDVAFAIGLSQTPEALDVLAKALNDNSLSGQPDTIGPALARYGKPESVKLLVGMLKHENPYFRARAAEYLGMTREPGVRFPLLVPQNDDSVVPPLLEALKDEDDYVRQEAIESLGLIQSPKAISGIIPFLQDKDSETRTKAVEALGRIGDPGTIDAIGALATDKYKPARVLVVAALGTINNGDKGLKYLNIMLKDSDTHIRASAAVMVGCIGGQQALEMLQLLKDDKDKEVQLDYHIAMWLAKGPYTMKQLQEALLSGEKYAGLGAVMYLIKLNTPEALSLLESSMKSIEDTDVRFTIDNTIGNMKKSLELKDRRKHR